MTEIRGTATRTARLHREICDEVGLSQPVTMFFDHPTPEALADHPRWEVLGETLLQPSSSLVGSVGSDPIAVVGMACRCPGGVATPEDLWELVASGTDAITDFPSDRGWDRETLDASDPAASGASPVRRGGFLDDIAGFDAAFFGISPREATAMHPQQRLLLEVAWEALEYAAIDPGGLAGRAVGVFVGAFSSDYGPYLHRAAREYKGLTLTGMTPSVVSGRIAYALGLRGPAITTDTACSSSLV